MRRDSGAWRLGWAMGAWALLGIGASAGCTRVQAKTPGPIALATPDPPSRLVIPISVDPPPAPAPEKPTGAPAATGRGAGAARPTPPTTPPPAGQPTPPTTPPDAGSPVLQSGASLAELESRAKDRLDRAQRDLAKVTRASLGRDARDQYDSAARFIRMAQDAMTVKNFVYAFQCADKAATLAGLLIK